MKVKIFFVFMVLFIFSSVYAGGRALKQHQDSVTVTNSVSYIMTENLTGRSILIQNNDAAGIVYINLSGVATASTTMITLNPGDSIYLSNITNAVSAIGSIASNPNVAISEGK